MPTIMAFVPTNTDTTRLRLPPLCIRVTCTAGGGVQGAAAPILGLLAGPVVPLQQNAILLSSAHPSIDFACAATKLDEGMWTLAPQDVELQRSSTHPLALIVPGLRLKVLMPSGAGGPQDRLAYAHVFSCSVPLAACFKDLLTRNVHTLERTTFEDNMRYQVHIALDTRGLPLEAVQTMAVELQQGVDTLLHHQSVVAKIMGVPALKTVDELVAEVEEHKGRRAAAVSAVLKGLSAGEQSASMLDLQYGRAFGMRVDQQQCRALREGSVLGHGFEQTLLMASIAQASVIAKLAQEADVSTHETVRVQSVVENFVHKHGAEALMHLFSEKMQEVHCSRTQYEFDPSFAPNMSVTSAVQNPDGSMTLKVVPELALQPDPGEDQNLCPGMEYADLLSFFRTNGLLRRDCEDGAHFITACADLFRCLSAQQLAQFQSIILKSLPVDMQQLTNTFLYITAQLQMHAAQAEAAHAQAPPVPLEKVTVQNLGGMAAAERKFSRSMMATSLLAASPQLSTSFSASVSDPSSKLECSAKEYNEWWTGALASRDQNANLNGHCVSLSAGMAPLLSTSVRVEGSALDTRVDIHLLDTDLRVFESTAPARQMQQADTSAVKLNLSREPATQARLSLQQRLDKCGPLTRCMACNVRSSLHTEETKMVVSQALQAGAATMHVGAPTVQGADLVAGAIPTGPSIVPMQAFSLRTEASSDQELARQVAFSFYKTLLACGRGLVYTLDLTNGATFAGMPMSRRLKNTPAIVVGSPVEGIELRNLRALGALQSSFVLPAQEALSNMPPIMPMLLQQRMKLCPLRQQLVPLTGPELRAAQHACGMLTQTPLLSVAQDGENAQQRASTPHAEKTLANMRALHDAARKVVGSELHVTGGPFAETMFLTFA